MAFTITMNTMAKGARKPIEDGHYKAIISGLVQKPNQNPYIKCMTEDNRELKLWINSEQSIDIITENINSQLHIDDEMPFLLWIEDERVKGAEIELWVLTTQYTDKETGALKNGQNTTAYKPPMFDAIINGLL